MHTVARFLLATAGVWAASVFSTVPVGATGPTPRHCRSGLRTGRRRHRGAVARRSGCLVLAVHAAGGQRRIRPDPYTNGVMSGVVTHYAGCDAAGSQVVIFAGGPADGSTMSETLTGSLTNPMVFPQEQTTQVHVTTTYSDGLTLVEDGVVNHAFEEKVAAD